MAAPPFQMRVPAHYLSAYVDIRRLKKKLESLVQRAQRQRATVRRRLDILQRPRMLPYGRAQKPTSPAAAGEHQDVDSPASLSASTDPSHTHFLPSAAAAAARADDGMAGSSLRAEAETLSLLPGVSSCSTLTLWKQWEGIGLYSITHRRKQLRGNSWRPQHGSRLTHLSGPQQNIGSDRKTLQGNSVWSAALHQVHTCLQVRAQCLIVRHLPFLVFGTSDKELEASLLGPRSALEKLQQRASNLAPTQMVASVYFDSANAYSYERRIRRFEGAQLLRFRWYGTNNNGPDEDIFIERKTHHESWSGLSSTKERFVVPQRLVAPYMLLQRKARDLLLEASGFEPPETDGGQSPGDPTVSSAAESSKPDSVDRVAIDAAGIGASEYIAKNCKLKKAIELGEEIQEEIAEHQLQPMVRISLDTNLCMVNEYRPQRQEYGGFNWCRLADELLGKDEVVRFPYAILEVKVQQQPPPAWVQSMLLLADATLVYKFSKFQHGMAFLHRDKISSGLLPHWLQTPLSAQQQNQDEQSSANKKRSSLGVPALGGSLFESLRNSPDSLLTPLARSLADQHAPRLSPSDALGVKKRSLFPVGEGKPAVATEPDWTEQQLQLQQAPRPICQDSSAEGEFEEERASGVILSSADSMRQRLVRRHIRTVRKVDPKTSFAGERTFLHYIQKGLYLAGASLARVAKAGVANVVQRIDSRLGPVLAFIAAGVATVLVLVFQIDVNLRSVLHHQRADNLSHYRENVQSASQ
ncbi:Vacuolar transporter chaperone 2, related [Eimeria necatrix]|uniref:Vacuolar transporter chaperone 2, related n=1 Tax=Eimeria necatrix TaxID=51315 RepID=U6MIB1_9EIME|nr:Vacuolar transporter chaperone 2, related [Eimeria necatrix]CDJ62803.1 Vacuolar transporter chaperone 2, related [Eimeria necatrix]